MRQNKRHIFNAVLLFGEYGIIGDAMGLSMPYDSYKGSFCFPQQGCSVPDSSLEGYALFLEDFCQDPHSGIKLDVERLKKDIARGMVFSSNIPQGYGVGSSGALVAAVYENYALDKISSKDISAEKLKELKAILGRMEDYFHGKSSGLDPLICYLNLPVLIHPSGQIAPVGLPDEKMPAEGGIFLLDTGLSRSSGRMIELFFEKMKAASFSQMVEGDFRRYNNACIDCFLHRDVKGLFSNMKKLSRLVFENFSQMIPPHIHALWQEGIRTQAYYLKLCGAGGGGFILGFTRDMARAQQMLKDYSIEVIHRF